MLKRGWNETDIEDFIADYNESIKSPDLIHLPLEFWLQDKPKIRNYYLDKDGHIVDEEI